MGKSKSGKNLANPIQVIRLALKLSSKYERTRLRTRLETRKFSFVVLKLKQYNFSSFCSHKIVYFYVNQHTCHERYFTTIDYYVTCPRQFATHLNRRSQKNKSLYCTQNTPQKANQSVTGLVQQVNSVDNQLDRKYLCPEEDEDVPPHFATILDAQTFTKQRIRDSQSIKNQNLSVQPLTG